MKKYLLGCIAAFVPVVGHAKWDKPIDVVIWEIAPSSSGSRWIEIHNLTTAQADGMYHIEVLQRKFGDETWHIEHLKAHMAITEAALRASILKKLPKERSVYPDPFHDAYREWKRLFAGGKAPVCSTNVLDCLK